MVFLFYLQAIGLGAGLAMDACAVSMTNGLSFPKIKVKKAIFISLTFAVFQALMPLIGYFIGHAFINIIRSAIPYIALFVLGFLGIKMIIDGIKDEDDLSKDNKKSNLSLKVVLVQAIATSIDALSVGVTIANYSLIMAIVSAIIIAIVTFITCIIAVNIGKKFGDKLGNKAIIAGGIILIIIGLEIFIKGILSL